MFDSLPASELPEEYQRGVVGDLNQLERAWHELVEAGETFRGLVTPLPDVP